MTSVLTCKDNYELLDNLRYHLEDATPGPWDYDYNSPNLILAEDGSGKLCLKIQPLGIGFNSSKNMDLLLFLRNNAETFMNLLIADEDRRDIGRSW